MSFNSLTVSGNLGGDAERKSLDSGNTVVNFSVAVSVGRGDAKTTMWVRCALWGKRAESSLFDYLKKGTQVIVSGPLSIREFTTNDGMPRYSVEMSVQEIELVGGKPDGARNDDPPLEL